MSDPISIYQDAVNEFNTATTEAAAIANKVAELGRALVNWRVVSFSNSPDAFPISSKSPTINFREWPSAAQVSAALARWHKASDSVKAAYAAIPESQRSVVVKPTTAG